MTPYDRQIQLEIEMAGLGTERFISKLNKNIEKERGAGTEAGSYLVKRAIHPLSLAITSFVEGVYSGKPCSR